MLQTCTTELQIDQTRQDEPEGGKSTPEIPNSLSVCFFIISTPVVGGKEAGGKDISAQRGGSGGVSMRRTPGLNMPNHMPPGEGGPKMRPYEAVNGGRSENEADQMG